MPQEIIIQPVLNGWIIRAGCQTIVYADAAKMIADFREWVLEPEKVEGYFKEMMARKGVPVPQCAPTPMAAENYASPQSVGAAIERAPDRLTNPRR